MIQRQFQVGERAVLILPESAGPCGRAVPQQRATKVCDIVQRGHDGQSRGLRLSRLLKQGGTFASVCRSDLLAKGHFLFCRSRSLQSGHFSVQRSAELSVRRRNSGGGNPGCCQHDPGRSCSDTRPARSARCCSSCRHGSHDPNPAKNARRQNLRLGGKRQTERECNYPGMLPNAVYRELPRCTGMTSAKDVRSHFA